MVNEVNDNNDSRKILAVIVMIGVLMFSISGATFAYFALSVNSVNTISGNAATASLTFSPAPTIQQPASTANRAKPLVPQISWNGTNNVLQKALNGTSSNKCVDGNGNIVCRTYSFTIKNNSTATAVVNGSIQFSWASGSTFSHLKWKLMTDANTVAISSSDGGTIASTTAATFDSGLSLAPNATKSYNIIVWIEESNGDQTQIDKGTFYATITFTSNNGGITSTIRS